MEPTSWSNYGLVTALKEGTATITATSVATDADGNHATASCEITVKGLTSVSFKVNGQMEDLSCGKIGVLPGVSAVSGLYVADEQRREVDAKQLFREATENTCSSPRSFACAPAKADNGEDICLIGKQTNGSTNAATTTAQSAESASSKTVPVEVTARNADGAAVASTNGVITVEFDAQKLELSGVAVHAGYKSVEIGDGLVKFAYANAEEIPAGQPVATLTFQTRACVSTEVSSFYEQVNDGKPAAKSSTAVSTHEPVVQNASNPTCTEDGYTGDTVCSICGEMLEPGEVIPAHCASKIFQDVDIAKWYHPYIDYVVDKGLMQGMGNGMFAPDANMTRAQLVTVLYRMAGSPHVESATSFQDVPVGTWYTDAVVWAYANGVTKGVTPDYFQPHAPVTREQMFTLFARFAALNGETIETKGDLTNFTDAASLSPYAVEAVTWAYESGLLVGISSNTLAPRGTSSRAQVATVLTRYCEIFG